MHFSVLAHRKSGSSRDSYLPLRIIWISLNSPILMARTIKLKVKTTIILYLWHMINRDSEVSNQEGRNQMLRPLIADNEQIGKAEPVQPQKERLQSLDAYRGLTILGMVMADHVEDMEGGFWWLVHPAWNGLSFADLVFPAFLFIMGVAIPLATSKNRPIKPKNVIRVFLLFAIGLLLNIIEQFDFAHLRILGILQRMSVCYGIILFIHWWTDYGTHEIKRRVAGFVMVGFLIVYASLMLSWEDPSINCYRNNNLDPFCNFAGYIDRAVFTEAHIMEQTDPEGLFSTLTASFTTFVGYCFGLMLLKHKKHLDTLIKYWLLVAFLCLLAIYPCSLFMPFNKRLYTLTFLFAVLSTSATALTLSLLVIDFIPKAVKRQSKIVRAIIQPFIWLGMNPLAIFIVLQLLFDLLKNWITINGSTPYQLFYDACFSWMSPGIGTAIYALFYGVVYTIIAGLLYKFKIFIRL